MADSYAGRTRIINPGLANQFTLSYDIVLNNITLFNNEYVLGLEPIDSFPVAARFIFDNMPLFPTISSAVTLYSLLIQQYKSFSSVALAA